MAEAAVDSGDMKLKLSEGPWPREVVEVCDLVMKGGVTSGVVYPGPSVALRGFPGSCP